MVKGIARGCELAGCALIGGETAEMPGMYPQGEYDLAGFCVGVVEKEPHHRRPLDPPGRRAARPRLERRALQRLFADPQDPRARATGRSRSAGDALLEPTRIYVKPVLALLAAVPVKGLAHITGGGITGNVPRMLPAGHARGDPQGGLAAAAAVRAGCSAKGNVAEDEMHRVFNCGIGMAVVAAPADAARAAQALRAAGETVYEIGTIEAGAGEPEAIVV